MTTLPNRPKMALVVIDMQNDVLEDAYARDAVISRIRMLVERARSAGTPVVWVQHSAPDLVEGSEGWRYVTELARRDSEPLVPKEYGDAFEATGLEQVLSDRGVGHVVVAGAETDACIRSTIHGAFTRGYDVTLVSDAHTAQDKTSWGAPAVPDVITHTNLYWSFQTAPGRAARVVKAAGVAFG